MSAPRVALAALVLASAPATLVLSPQASAALNPDGDLTDEAVYAAACASCHGADGTGAPVAQLGFDDPPIPDFTECNFSSREPAPDWETVAHMGGPVRGFSEVMPSFTEALTEDEIAAAVRHIKGLCEEKKRWPSGVHNLPRPLYTSKAYVEDEAVLTVSADVEGPAAITTDLIYERRFGRRNNFEIKLPWKDLEGDDGWVHGIGDPAIAVKRNVIHSEATGSILGLVAEVILPVGNADLGLGKGYGIFEPFAVYGQGLPVASFFQAQVGAEIPMVSGHAQELFWRGTLGKSFFAAGGRGRAWSPMVEVLGGLELEDGAAPDWSLVPQVHVTLNTRQHIMLVVGARVPLTDVDTTDTAVRVSLLWDWFDGGLTDGW